MMKHLLNAVRLQVQRAMASIVSSRVGAITSYDPNTFTAVVSLQPDSIITGWLQIASPWIGNKWGMFAAPNIGDLVQVEYINGDLQAGMIVGRFYNQVSQPLPVPSGEFWLVHKLLQSLKLTNDGKIAISDGHGATITMNGDGTITSAASTWNHTGTVSFTGNVNVSETLTATTDVVGGGKSLKSHVHGGVQIGGSDTGPPV